jgi:hypothetical protein
VTIAALFLNSKNTTRASAMAGLSLVVCGFIIVCHASWVYCRRVNLMASGQPYGYVDHVGPAILAVAALFGTSVIVLYFISVVNVPVRIALPRQAIVPALGICDQYSLQDTSPLELQPSDALVDAGNDLLIIPSLSQILGLPISTVNVSQPTILAEVPEMDFEAVTFVGDRLFAVSEGPKSSMLFEFTWFANTFVHVQTFKIQAALVEGMAFVPDSSGGKLYIAGNEAVPGATTGSTSGVVYIYDVPAAAAAPVPSGTAAAAITSRKRLNANLMNEGLVDSKIGSLYYFEDVLYILHDNSRIVRAWDVKKGTILAEFFVPYVGGGYSLQWEGFALQRTSDGALKMYLTLDTPAQVWTLLVQENATALGSLILPECAAATNGTTIPAGRAKFMSF